MILDSVNFAGTQNKHNSQSNAVNNFRNKQNKINIKLRP